MKKFVLLAVMSAFLIGCDMNVTFNVNNVEQKKPALINDNSEKIESLPVMVNGKNTTCLAKAGKIYKCADVWKIRELSDSEIDALWLL